MPIVNQDQLLVLYPNWAEWRSDRPDGAVAAPLVEPAASFCATCWGQGRIFEPAANGEGYIPVSCVACAVRDTD
jgi:hypothetical protein